MGPHARSGRLFCPFHWIDLQAVQIYRNLSLVFMRVSEGQRGIVALPYRDASWTLCSPLSMRARFAVLPYLKSLFRIISGFPQPRFYAASSVSRCTPCTLLLIAAFPRFSPFRINELKVDFGNSSVTLRPRARAANSLVMVFFPPASRHKDSM